MSLLCLLGLFSLPRAELGNLNRDSLVDTLLELGAVSDHEKKLEPDEQGSEEDGLEEVVQQGGGSTLELAVADKLRDPAYDMDGKGGLVGTLRVLDAEVVCACRGGEADQGQGASSDRFKKEI